MLFADYLLTSETATGLAKEGPFGILVTLIIVFGAMVVLLRWIDVKRETRRDDSREQKFIDLKNEWIISNKSLAESLAALSANVIKLEEILNGQREILRDINARIDKMDAESDDVVDKVAIHDQKIQEHEKALAEIQGNPVKAVDKATGAKATSAKAPAKKSAKKKNAV